MRDLFPILLSTMFFLSPNWAHAVTETKAQTICNSVIPKKYPKSKVIQKFKLMRVGKNLAKKPHYRWSWRIRSPAGPKTITCRVFDDGSYEVKKQNL